MKRLVRLFMVILVLCLPFGASTSARAVSDNAQSEAEQADKLQAALDAYRQKETTSDLTPPKLAANPLYLSSKRAEVNLLEGVTAVDNRDERLTIEVAGYANPTHVALSQLKTGVQWIRYSATDAAGNTGYLMRAVVVEHLPTQRSQDLTPPEVMSEPFYVRAGTLTLAQFIDAKENLVAYDHVEGDLTYAFRFDQKRNMDFDLTQAGRYLVEWQVEDSQHNLATVKQWVIVLDEADLLP